MNGKHFDPNTIRLAAGIAGVVALALLLLGGLIGVSRIFGTPESRAEAKAAELAAESDTIYDNALNAARASNAQEIAESEAEGEMAWNNMVAAWAPFIAGVWSGAKIVVIVAFVIGVGYVGIVMVPVWVNSRNTRMQAGDAHALLAATVAMQVSPDGKTTAITTNKGTVILDDRFAGGMASIERGILPVPDAKLAGQQALAYHAANTKNDPDGMAWHALLNAQGRNGNGQSLQPARTGRIYSPGDPEYKDLD